MNKLHIAIVHDTLLNENLGFQNTDETALKREVQRHLFYSLSPTSDAGEIFDRDYGAAFDDEEYDEAYEDILDPSADWDDLNIYEYEVHYACIDLVPDTSKADDIKSVQRATKGTVYPRFEDVQYTVNGVDTYPVLLHFTDSMAAITYYCYSHDTPRHVGERIAKQLEIDYRRSIRFVYVDEDEDSQRPLDRYFRGELRDE